MLATRHDRLAARRQVATVAARFPVQAATSGSGFCEREEADVVISVLQLSLCFNGTISGNTVEVRVHWKYNINLLGRRCCLMTADRQSYARLPTIDQEVLGSVRSRRDRVSVSV